MTLAIDHSRAIRGHPQQEALVRAIVAAPDSEQETDWLEWKGAGNIGEKPRQAIAAKHILGFANRHPDAAEAWAEGCAYLVVGASPGELSGCSVHDIADITKWIGAYVGPPGDAPVWTPTYVRVDGVDVLLVTIERPRWGDPIWTLRKEHPDLGFREGTPFIRRQGNTVSASTSEIRMLTARAGSGPRRLSLSLELREGDHAIALAESGSFLDRWQRERRVELDPPRTPPKQAVPPGAQAIAESVRQFMEIQNAFARTQMAESRSRDKFEAELDQYLAEGRLALPAELRRRALKRGFGKLRFTLVNPTDHNFTDVGVELRFSQPGVSAFFGWLEVEGPEMPASPAKWGSHSMSRMFDSLSIAPALRPGLLESIRSVPSRPVGHIDNSGSTRIRFADIHVRPQHEHRLDVIYLVAPTDSAGTELVGEWSATATDTSGVVSDSIHVPVASDIPEESDLMGHDSHGDEDEDEDDGGR